MTTTISTLQNKSASTSFTNQNRNSTSFSLQARDIGESLLLKEDGDYLLSEDGSGIVLEQAVQGDAWTLQNKS